ncbi:hypothetical protein J5X84_36130 [Streptosporangiaceae bacterium NEAU-GS5]|nr:hypothetical protein [Streptosporangiaceae bacterium NEAU-GS5]
MSGLGARAIQDALVSHALTLGVFDRVNTHEPLKNAPGNGITCSMWLGPGLPFNRRSGLASTTVRLMFVARLQTAGLQLNPDDVDMNLLDALDVLYTAYHGDFTLGALGQIDLLGSAGIPLSWDTGWIVQDGKQFRAYLLSIPVLVDDVWEQTP